MATPRKVAKKPRPAYATFHNAKLHLPKDPFLYKLRRVYWLLANMHRLLEKDPTAVPAKQYLELLDLFSTLTTEAAKRGLDTRQGRLDARKRVDSTAVAEIGDQDDAAALGDSLPFSVGS